MPAGPSVGIRGVPRTFEAVSGSALLACALVCTGCQGYIAGADPASPKDGSESAALPDRDKPALGADASVVSKSSVTDRELRADNATLFETASRYFPGDDAAASTPRLFRLTRIQLDLTTQALLPAAYKAAATRAADAMPRDPLQTNYEYADNLSFNAANFTPYTQWVDALAQAVRAQPASVVDCSDAADEPCLRQQAQDFVRRAFRGVSLDDQLSHYTSFFVSEVKQLGLPDATADLVSLTLTSPSYVFRDEVPRAGQPLSAAQRLQNITYALADAPPQALGLEPDRAEMYVGSADAQRATIEDVLQSELARRKLVRFFLAWLEVREPDDFVIASDVFPEFTPEVAQAIVSDTTRFLEDTLAADAPSLTSITQAHEAFVSDVLADLYDVPDGDESLPRALDPTERLGIFTQPAVIASHSGPTTTRLIKRGVFFTRKVMCLPLGQPPQGVDTTLPEIESATERQRVEQATQGQVCQGCHALINPFGFMQENYDAIGRYRTQDQGHPVDASMRFDALDEGPLETSSPVEALSTLTSSLRFQQCFTRQLFRFYMGREELSDEGPLLRQMFFELANGQDQDVVQMLRTLAASTPFSDRSEAP